MANYKSNYNNLIKDFKDNIEQSMKECGQLGVKAIEQEAPVITGKLKGSNEYKSYPTSVDFFNNTPYAPYVEFGTYKMSSNPFFRRGLIGSLDMFKAIIFKNLKL